MASTIDAYAAAARVGIDLVVNQFAKDKSLIYPRIFDKVTTTQQFFRSVEEQDLGLMDQVNENEPHPEDTYSMQNSKDHYWYIFKKKLVVSEDKMRSDQTGRFSPANQAKKLVSAYNNTMESLHAARFNLGFSTSYLVGDGKPLFDAPSIGQGGHPIDGGVQHNAGYYDGSTYAYTSLSETALENTLKNMQLSKSHKGNVGGYNGPYKLLVTTGNMFFAEKLLASMQVLGSANNDPNVVKKRISEVIVMPWVTGNSWFLLDETVDNPLKTLEFEAMRKYTKANEDAQNVEMGVSVKVAPIAVGWRGAWGQYVA